MLAPLRRWSVESAVLLLYLVVSVSSSGCGEPVAVPAASCSAPDLCSDEQCSRVVVVDADTAYCVRGLALDQGPCYCDSDCYMGLSCNTTGESVEHEKHGEAAGVDGSTDLPTDPPRPYSGVCVTAPATKNVAAGYVSILIAALFFGSNYLPVRRMRTGHGVFFQFAMSIGILAVGVAVQLVRGSSTIYPEAMLGGMMWSIGNCASIRVINILGVGLAVTTWGCSSMLMGWASGRFGIWDCKKEVPTSEVASALSVATGVVGIVLFGFVKPGRDDVHGGETRDDATLASHSKLQADSSEASALLNGPIVTTATTGASSVAEVEPLSASKRYLGFAMALCCGVFYGFTFDPSQSMMDHYAERTLAGDVKYSSNGLDYTFSAFLGIFLTSSAYMALVSLLHSRFPFLEKDDITPAIDMFLPALISGAMWAVAATAWFVANTNLGLSVSYPLIALGPCVVASLWGIFYLREIHGRRNFLFLAAAFAAVVLSCVCTVLSQ